MHLCKLLTLFTIWLVLLDIFKPGVVFYSVIKGLLMLHGKTMKPS